jgi:hypothetical protein
LRGYILRTGLAFAKQILVTTGASCCKLG